MSVNETRTREQLEAYITQAMERASDKQLRAMAGMLDAFGEAPPRGEPVVPKLLEKPTDAQLAEELKHRAGRDQRIDAEEMFARVTSRLAREHV